ncbi:hypothetical protein HY629_02690 [Candidatus Uhrbacteria bacterium]|nr:hypothetical protein [Candidatus Uhrbacteria bacterium]
MINAKAFREVLPRVERVARHSIVFRRKKIGALCSIAEEAHLDAIGRKVIARYARQTFRRADQLRDHYDLSERTQSKLVLGAALIGLPIGAMLGLTLGVQYIGLLALWVGMALG